MSEIEISNQVFENLVQKNKSALELHSISDFTFIKGIVDANLLSEASAHFDIFANIMRETKDPSVAEFIRTYLSASENFDKEISMLLSVALPTNNVVQVCIDALKQKKPNHPVASLNSNACVEFGFDGLFKGKKIYLDISTSDKYSGKCILVNFDNILNSWAICSIVEKAGGETVLAVEESENFDLSSSIMPPVIVFFNENQESEMHNKKRANFLRN